MLRCIYCDKEKEIFEFSEEHIIPRFLGGTSKIINFCTTRVCTKCNTLLGRYVDASFARQYFMKSVETSSFSGCFDYNPREGNIFQLIYFGKNLQIAEFENYDVEVWLGPDAGTLWHIRNKHDDSFYSYAGGDPVASRKDKTSRVYVFFASEEPFWFFSALKSAKDHFYNQPIYFGTETDIENKLPLSRLPGRFCRKLETHNHEVALIRKILDRGEPLQNSISMDIYFDVRFLAKLAIGFGFAFFGDSFLSLTYTNKLRSLMFTRRSKLLEASDRIGMKSYMAGLTDKTLSIVAIPHAFVFAVIPIKKEYILVIITPSGHHLQVTLTDSDNDGRLMSANIDGNCVIVFPTIREAVWPLRFDELVAHKVARLPLPALEAIVKRWSPPDVFPRRRNPT